MTFEHEDELKEYNYEVELNITRDCVAVISVFGLFGHDRRSDRKDRRPNTKRPKRPAVIRVAFLDDRNFG